MGKGGLTLASISLLANVPAVGRGPTGTLSTLILFFGSLVFFGFVLFRWVASSPHTFLAGSSSGHA